MKRHYTRRTRTALCALLTAFAASGIGPVTAQTPGPFYQKVTSADEIADGGIYVLTAYGTADSPVCLMPANGNPVYEDFSMPFYDKEYGTFEDDRFYAVSPGTDGKAAEIGLHEFSDGTYALRFGERYFSYYSYAKWFNTELPTADTGKWKIEFNDNGSVHIYLNTGNTHLIYNKSFKQLKTSSWNSFGNFDLYLWRKMVPLTFAAPVEGWATFYTKDAYEMPAGVDGYAVYNAPASGSLSPTAVYRGGELVPGGTPLLVHTDASLPVTLEVPALDKSVEPDSRAAENKLVGMLEPGNTAAPAGGDDADYYFYKLSTKNGANPGLYAGAADAGVFAMTGYNRAYLALPKADAAQAVAFAAGFSLTDGPATGIGSATTTGATKAGTVYTLSGVRLNTPADRLPAGIYIVDGKKVLVK